MKFLIRLAKADVAFYLLPPIMLNLVAGTVAQSFMGLYEAQRVFFGSFIIWAGPIPLPGGYILTGALAVCLFLKFVLRSAWKRKHAGLHTAHLGALVLLAGGLFTALSAREGYMIIAEGDSSPYVYDYHQRALYLFKNDALVQSVSFEKLLSEPVRVPFSLQVASACANCEIQKRGGDLKAMRGMARGMQLRAAKPEKEPEKNIGGVTLEIKGADEKQDGVYVAFEGMPKPIEIKSGRDVYKIMFGREQRLLPFAVRLRDFQKENYPGLERAKSYSSDIEILENGGAWPARVEMNAPLRYKGYTFYQSSFGDAGAREATVLAVVENRGRLFPYIGAALLGIGLLLHLIIKARAEKRA